MLPPRLQWAQGPLASFTSEVVHMSQETTIYKEFKP